MDIKRKKSCMECKIKKCEKTCIEKYGVRNVSFIPEIQKKIVQNSKKHKKYFFPSGRMEYIQGYENFAIDLLLDSKIEENDIICVGEIPTFLYKDENMKDKMYFPDLMIRSSKTIIEVKSDWTYLKEVDKNYRKFSAVLENGSYNFRLLIFGDKRQILYDNTFKPYQTLHISFENEKWNMENNFSCFIKWLS